MCEKIVITRVEQTLISPAIRRNISAPQAFWLCHPQGLSFPRIHGQPDCHPTGLYPDMRIAIASDHRGIDSKESLTELLRSWQQDVQDFGPNSEESVDYPDFAAAVAGGVSRGEFDRGILICGTGIGMCITANKFPGVRAVNCYDELTAETSRRHNDANVLCLSADLLGEQLVHRMLEVWLRTEFESGRHARRVEKIANLERNLHCGDSTQSAPDTTTSCGDEPRDLSCS